MFLHSVSLVAHDKFGESRAAWIFLVTLFSKGVIPFNDLNLQIKQSNCNWRVLKKIGVGLLNPCYFHCHTVK